MNQLSTEPLSTRNTLDVLIYNEKMKTEFFFFFYEDVVTFMAIDERTLKSKYRRIPHVKAISIAAKALRLGSSMEAAQ